MILFGSRYLSGKSVFGFVGGSVSLSIPFWSSEVVVLSGFGWYVGGGVLLLVVEVCPVFEDGFWRNGGPWPLSSVSSDSGLEFCGGCSFGFEVGE